MAYSAKLMTLAAMLVIASIYIAEVSACLGLAVLVTALVVMGKAIHEEHIRIKAERENAEVEEAIDRMGGIM